MRKMVVFWTFFLLGLVFLSGVNSAKTKDFKCSGQSEVTFNGNVFIGLKKQIITEATNSEIDISVDVTTTEENGLILWKRSTSSEDHIGLGIVDGFVMFEYNYGKENRRVQIKSKTKINDGNKHHVNAIKRNGGSGNLFVDFDEELVDPEPPIIEDKLDLSQGLLYLGGLPQNLDVATTTKGSFSSAFTGCVTSLSVGFSVGGSTVSVSSETKDNFYSKTASGFLVEGGLGVTCEEKCPYTKQQLRPREEHADAKAGSGEISKSIFVAALANLFLMMC